MGAAHTFVCTRRVRPRAHQIIIVEKYSMLNWRKLVAVSADAVQFWWSSRAKLLKRQTKSCSSERYPQCKFHYFSTAFRCVGTRICACVL